MNLYHVVISEDEVPVEVDAPTAKEAAQWVAKHFERAVLDAALVTWIPKELWS